MKMVYVQKTVTYPIKMKMPQMKKVLVPTEVVMVVVTVALQC